MQGRSPSNTQEGGQPFVVMVASVSADDDSNSGGGLAVVSQATMVWDGCTSGYLDPSMCARSAVGSPARTET